MALAFLESKDSAYFKITSKDITDRIFTEDIISFNYTEEISRYNSGSISVYDPDHFYSKVLRFGALLEIEFGYSNPSNIFTSLLSSSNPNEAFGAGVRTGIKAYIQNPRGNAGANGVVTYNCNFYGSEVLSTKKYRTHTGITKGALITLLMTELGVVAPTVNFLTQNELLDANKQIMQRETNYKLLLRLAREWRCIFRVSTSPLGTLTGIFISTNNIDLKTLPQQLSGAIGGDSLFLEYQSGVRNVLEYEWENHQGKSGSGDNVRIIQGADGKPQFIRYVAQGDTIKAYRFNPEKVKARLKAQGNFIKRFDKLKEWLSVSDFEKVKWAFDPVKLSTAPQGLGYSMNCKMIGNPLMSAPLKIYYGQGFPVFFTPKVVKGHITNYYCSKVQHTIDRSGYFMDLEIADAYTASGGMLVG